VILDDERWWGPRRSHTFHGRDLFAPVAAHLAAGVPFGDLGTQIDPADLVPATKLPIEIGDGVLHTSVRIVDGFGTLVLTGDREAIESSIGPLTTGEPLKIKVGDQTVTTVWANRFGDVPEHEPLCYIDSTGRLALAVNRGSAADRYGAVRRTLVVITRA
jgi:S-adenosylmethionine hydrolase